MLSMKDYSRARGLRQEAARAAGAPVVALDDTSDLPPVWRGSGKQIPASTAVRQLGTPRENAVVADILAGAGIEPVHAGMSDDEARAESRLVARWEREGQQAQTEAARWERREQQRIREENAKAARRAEREARKAANARLGLRESAPPTEADVRAARAAAQTGPSHVGDRLDHAAFERDLERLLRGVR